MSNFLFLKSGYYWAGVGVVIAAAVILAFVSATRAAGPKSVNLEVGMTRALIFKKLGTPDDNVVLNPMMTYQVEPGVELVVSFSEPYRTGKSMKDKVTDLAVCSGNAKIRCTGFAYRKTKAN